MSVSPPPNQAEETVLLCRFCGHLNDPSGSGGRCAQCGAFSGLESVARDDARRRSRRLRLDFLRHRLTRAAVIILPIVGLLVWVLWAYTDLPPDPPLPSTGIGNSAAALAPGSWPQAGGGVSNASAAIVPSLPTDTAPETVWEYVAGAPIVAPPAVSGDRVFLTAEDGSVVALDRNDGSVVWREDSGLTAAVTPAVADGLVFVVFKPGIVSALHADTGEPAWSRRLEVASLPSPTIADGRLFVAETDRDRLLALDAQTGETLWDYRLDDWVIAPPAIHDGLLIATANDAKVHILDVNKGRLRMIYDASQGRWVRGGPAVSDDLLHFSSFGGRVWGIDYRGHRYPLERQIAILHTQFWVWGFFSEGPVQQGYVWSTQTDGEQPYQPALSDNTVVVSDASGVVTALDAESGEMLWETDLDTDITAPATIAGPVALVGDDNGIVTALSLADGSQRWAATLPGAVTASPVASGDLMLTPTLASGGTLIAAR